MTHYNSYVSYFNIIVLIVSDQPFSRLSQRPGGDIASRLVFSCIVWSHMAEISRKLQLIRRKLLRYFCVRGCLLMASCLLLALLLLLSMAVTDVVQQHVRHLAIPQTDPSILCSFGKGNYLVYQSPGLTDGKIKENQNQRR